MRLFVVLLMCSSLVRATQSNEFTVVAYNVENLFDVDGIAIYQDYAQDEADDPFTYSRQKFLTKLENAVAVLQTVNSGQGPEVILFQELEADFSPESSVEDLDQFLSERQQLTVQAMLTDQWQAEYAGLPSEAWLLKAMSDAGLEGYQVVVAPSKGMDAGIAHTNAVFSKFPIVSVDLHPLEQARDILEVEVDVLGHSLFLYANHWKSGASNPSREPIRAQNASVLRALIEERLLQDAYADIIIGGDLNSHYNHSLLNPEIETGINTVLGSQGDELAIRELDGPDLYNLWFELPAEQRYSEVWKGRRGTLMHIIMSRGLYDSSGVSYIDGSFTPIILPGINADALERPLAWNFAGDSGGGASDHFPVAARFCIREGEAGHFTELNAPSSGKDALEVELRHDYQPELELDVPDGAFIGALDDSALGPYVGRLYRVEARVLKYRPLLIQVDGVTWPAYAPSKKVAAKLKKLKSDVEHSLLVKLDIWKGERQFVIEGIRSVGN